MLFSLGEVPSSTKEEEEHLLGLPSFRSKQALTYPEN